jgi:hypothetical protein
VMRLRTVEILFLCFLLTVQWNVTCLLGADCGVTRHRNKTPKT